MSTNGLPLSPWAKFPFSHPTSFKKLLKMLDTTSILNCRAVCTNWRDWFSISETIWSSVLPTVMSRAFERTTRVEVEQIWDIRLDLLYDMRDECWTEEQNMSTAIRIERATKQSLWWEFEDTLEVISNLHEAFSRGQMAGLCVGPVSIFLRSKVAHPAVLKVMGETLARHLNCVIIDERDKEASVVRQCLLRAMVSCQQVPRWVFKDMENLGWLEEEEDIKESESGDTEENHIPTDVEKLTPNKFSFGYFFTFILNFMSALVSPLWRLSISSQPEDTNTTEDSDKEEQEEDTMYKTAPPPAHSVFPTVLELLDCDSPWLKQMLVKKAGIDKILVVPKFEEVTRHLEQVDAKFTIVGLDLSGTVCQLECGALTSQETL